MAGGRTERVVVITGASSGVGRAIARAFGGGKAKVGLIARGEDGLDAAAREIESLGGEALVLPVDVADAAAVQRAADEIVRRWGRIDVWVNNAMTSVFARVVDTSPDEYRRVTEVTYLGYVHGTLAALRHMRPRNAGTIIQIGSALAYRSIPLQSAYCGAKAAIRAFTDALRTELLHERSRVRVTALQLPAINTPQFEVVRNRQPLHARPVAPVYQPETIAQATLHAAEQAPREMWIGWSTVGAVLGQALAPGLLDRYLARKAWGGQFTEALPPTDRDNVDAPVPGDHGAHGQFDAEARPVNTQLWLRLHRGTVAVAALGAAALIWKLRQPRKLAW